MSHFNRRKRTVALLCLCAVLLTAVAAAGLLLAGEAMTTDFSRKNQPPGTSSAPTGWGGTCSPAPSPGCPSVSGSGC